MRIGTQARWWQLRIPNSWSAQRGQQIVHRQEPPLHPCHLHCPRDQNFDRGLQTCHHHRRLFLYSQRRSLKVFDKNGRSWTISMWNNDPMTVWTMAIGPGKLPRLITGSLTIHQAKKYYVWARSWICGSPYEIPSVVKHFAFGFFA